MAEQTEGQGHEADGAPRRSLSGFAAVDARIVTRYSDTVIRSFRHKGIEAFFKKGTTRGIQAAHKDRLSRQLFALNNAADPQDMNVPGWRLHCLQGKLQNHWSIMVNGNWRLTFTFEDGDAVLVDYQDYH